MSKIAILAAVIAGTAVSTTHAQSWGFGVEIGAFVHVAGAALGVSAVIASSATAFSALKLAGGAYLVVLGIKRLRERDAAAPSGFEAGLARTSIFRQGRHTVARSVSVTP